MISRLKNAARRLVAPRDASTEILPGNWQPPSATDADIAYHVDFAITSGEAYRERAESMGVKIKGARFLEIGPGISFGPMAYVRAAGAVATVTDRWLAPWTKGFHDRIYAALADRLEGRPGFDTAPIRRMVAAGRYDDSAIICLRDAAENLESIPDNSYDAIVSNAVLEHIKDPARAFAELFRVTRPGGVGLHQVDFRDHRDFSRPLDHLLLSPGEFLALNEGRSFEFGSQLRQADYAVLLRGAGFEIERFDSNETAIAAYLDDLLSRLAAGRHPKRTEWTREGLSCLGGEFRLRKPSQASSGQPAGAAEP